MTGREEKSAVPVPNDYFEADKSVPIPIPKVAKEKQEKKETLAFCFSPPVDTLHHLETDFHDHSNPRNRVKSGFFSSTMEKLYNIVKAYRFAPNYSQHTPIFLLGKSYDIGSECTMLEGEITFDMLVQHSSGAKDFLKAFQSQFWFTYRNRFPLLVNSALSSDMGWGCMVRTGQMLLANGILKLVMNSNWDYEAGDQTIHNCILDWFIDYPGASHPFSIHNIISMGSYYNAKAGDWLSPSVISHILKMLVRKYRPFGITMYVAKESTICKESLAELCSSSSSSDGVEDHESIETFSPVIICIPVRLGLHTIEVGYISLLKLFLSSPLSLGFIGGKPNSALYFMGFQDNDFILLDPHLVQPTPPENRADEYSRSYHCPKPHKLFVGDIDPSLAIAFLCRTSQELSDFYEFVKTSSEQSKECIFEVKEKKEKKKKIASSEVSIILSSSSSSSSSKTKDQTIAVE